MRMPSVRSITPLRTMGFPNRGGEIVFCNPPYRDMSKWAKKCYEESLNGTLVVMLVPARTDTRWFHDYIYHKAEIRFIKGRLRFGGSSSNAPFPSMIVIYNERNLERH